MPLASILLALVCVQRLGELVLARRNTKALLARGGYEVGREHYPLIVLLHASWLIGLWLLAWDRPVDPWLLWPFLALQAGRFWVLSALGRRWTSRIVIVPGESLIVRGPYRFMAHPNYAIVVGEIALLPLMFGLWSYAVIFSTLNSLLLWRRITIESQALRSSQIVH